MNESTNLIKIYNVIKLLFKLRLKLVQTKITRRMHLSNIKMIVVPYQTLSAPAIITKFLAYQETLPLWSGHNNKQTKKQCIPSCSRFKMVVCILQSLCDRSGSCYSYAHFIELHHYTTHRASSGTCLPPPSRHHRLKKQMIVVQDQFPEGGWLCKSGDHCNTAPMDIMMILFNIPATSQPLI